MEPPNGISNAGINLEIKDKIVARAIIIALTQSICVLFDILVFIINLSFFNKMV